MKTVTVTARVSTSLVRRGQQTTVERTAVIDKLIADGRLIEIGAPVKPRALGKGNVDEVLAQVGNDQNLARAALDLEHDRDHPRSTLIAALEKVIGDHEEESE